MNILQDIFIITFVLSVVFVLMYCLLIFYFFRGWRTLLPVEDYPEVSEPVFLTVLVAARNESERLPELLKCLATQTYDKRFFEIIIVNDHSEDTTVDLVVKYQMSLPNLFIYSLEGDVSGKKAALTLGESKAQGTWIVTTDADCTMGCDWLTSMAQCIQSNLYTLVTAPVVLTGVSLRQKLEGLEFMSLIASTAGAIGEGRPIMCNGANMAFKKITGIGKDNHMNTAYTSGDDMFRMLWLKKQGHAIGFAKSSKAVVYTPATKTFAEFMSQRKRWFSKSTAYHDADISKVAWLVLLANLSFAYWFLVGLIYPGWIYMAMALFAVKTITDAVFVSTVSRYFGQRYEWGYYLLLAFIYLPYLLIIANTSIKSDFEWKKRTYKQ